MKNLNAHWQKVKILINAKGTVQYRM